MLNFNKASGLCIDTQELTMSTFRLSEFITRTCNMHGCVTYAFTSSTAAISMINKYANILINMDDPWPHPSITRLPYDEAQKYEYIYKCGSDIDGYVTEHVIQDRPVLYDATSAQGVIHIIPIIKNTDVLMINLRKILHIPITIVLSKPMTYLEPFSTSHGVGHVDVLYNLARFIRFPTACMPTATVSDSFKELIYSMFTFPVIKPDRIWGKQIINVSLTRDEIPMAQYLRQHKVYFSIGHTCSSFSFSLIEGTTIRFSIDDLTSFAEIMDLAKLMTKFKNDLNE